MPKNRKYAQGRLITLLGLTSAMAIGAFGLWRLSRQQWGVAALDLAIVACLLGAVWMGKRRDRLELAGAIMCVLTSAFCAIATVVIGPVVHGWVFLALVCNFYLAPPRLALLASGSLVAAASTTAFLREPGLEAITATTTWILACLFSYIFTHHVQNRHGTLEDLANLDQLTQVPNRRLMEEHLDRALKGQRTSPSGLLVVDIDKFKQVNDSFGHAAGDAVLESLADLLRSELRRGDHVYRYGGEEFVLFLPEIRHGALEAAAERIRASVESGVRSPGGPVTVSLGGAVMDPNDLEWQGWFSRADYALYEAKRDGGNAVRMAAAVDAAPEA